MIWGGVGGVVGVVVGFQIARYTMSPQQVVAYHEALKFVSAGEWRSADFSAVVDSLLFYTIGLGILGTVMGFFGGRQPVSPRAKLTTQCEACGHVVSLAAPACPNCGHPMARRDEPTEPGAE